MKYDAFISYRHSELDMFVAKKLHKDLETFKVPLSVQKKSGKKSIKRVFRDQEELPIGSDLTDNISGALVESEFLLVICSPRTPESYWVLKEIDTFIQLHDREHVLAVLIEGEPQDSFPPQLLVDEKGEPVEPLAADVRGATQKEMKKKMKTEVMRLAAPILHCSYDDLRQRHRERRLKKIVSLTVAIGSILTLLGVGFGIYSTKVALEIEAQYTAKQVNQSKYLADISSGLLEKGDRRAATLVALSALPSEDNDRPYVGDAVHALSNALYYYETGNRLAMDKLLYHDYPVSSIEFNEEGNYLTSYDQSQTVFVWEVESGNIVLEIAPSYKDSGYVRYIKYSNVIDDKLFVVTDDFLKVYDLEGNELKSIEYDSSVSYAEANTATSDLSVRSPKKATIYDTKTLEVKDEYDAEIASFVTDFAYSEDGKYIAAPLYNGNDEEKAIVQIFDRKTKKHYEKYVEGNYTCEVKIDNDGTIYVASYKTDGYFAAYDENGNVDVILQKFTLNGSEAEWTHSVKVEKTNFNMSYTYIKFRDYSDGNGKHDEVIMTSGNTLFTFNGKNGDLIASIGFPGKIQSIHLSATSGIGYVSEENGSFNFCNFTTGNHYTDYTIDTEKNISDLKIKSGVVAFRTYASPDVTLLSYHVGKDIEEIGDVGYTIDDMAVSDGGKYYYISDSSYSAVVEIYKTENNELVYSIEGDGTGTSYNEFLNENTFLYITNKGEMTFVNLDNATEEKLVILDGERMVSTEAYLTPNKKYMLLYADRFLTVIDIENRKEIYSKELSGETIEGARINQDGDMIYYLTSNSGLKSIDLITEEERDDYSEEIQISSSLNEKYKLSISNDGTILAICCMDSKMRLYDLLDEKIIDEIPFPCMTNIFVQFADDDYCIYMQGDDYYFRIYGVDEEAYLYIGLDQINPIHKITDYSDKNMILIENGYELIVFDYDYFEIASEVPNGRAYDYTNNKVYIKWYSTLYSSPYASVDDFMEEAKRQFPGAELTDAERLNYLVD